MRSSIRSLSVTVASLALLSAGGCSTSAPAAKLDRSDAAPVEPDDPPSDPVTGDSSEGKDAAAPKDAEACTTKVVINELMPEGNKPADEFIELYNPNPCDVPIGDYAIKYKNASGVPAEGAPLHKFASGATIKAKGFFVIGTTVFAGTKDDTFNGGSVTENGGMNTAGGQIALLDAAGQKVDAVGYGDAKGDYVEGKPAPKAANNASIARKTDGVDTNDNSADFDWVTTPTPGAAN